jgi:hypothetical protein
VTYWGSQADPKKRSQKNAIKLKAFWVDVDVKNLPSGYTTLEEALRAIAAFVDVSHMPPPSALIGSGGGCHIYWILGKGITVDEWRPLATALKNLLIDKKLICDTGVTTDAARILRVPGTFNHKTGVKRPVEFIPPTHDA